MLNHVVDVSIFFSIIYVAYKISIGSRVKEANKLFKCTRCERYVRKYQKINSGCPYCGKYHGNFSKTIEDKSWTKNNPHFPRINVIQYVGYVRWNLMEKKMKKETKEIEEYEKQEELFKKLEKGGKYIE